MRQIILKKRDEALSKGWGQIVTPLEIETSGRKHKLNCTDTEGIFRIIQPIYSPKAEPFKRRLAKSEAYTKSFKEEL